MAEIVNVRTHYSSVQNELAKAEGNLYCSNVDNEETLRKMELQREMETIEHDFKSLKQQFNQVTQDIHVGIRYH